MYKTVFISYKHKICDEFITRMMECLKKRGIESWIDSMIEG